ncbi:hypothetical protein Ae201684P_022299 [Aphanomyces euteiches]|uniref:Uncharacterized protein n=1 Tax=Aphanomyces euteiches TaxID=100861 RepID=A0A6G0X701_9STRA|nr:hypothetical protein Ae201684_007934 [Aphanomyces euteiches]KAH9074492.1 hypothetical protein Ae201684P_022299 [Aphanomyces euteiches]KAH9143220.1 hypothetical protein AeRB84_012757 [Aphanomyces euteiches]
MMSSALYQNRSGQVLSDADRLRQLFQTCDIPAMLSLLDAATARTTLCCVNPTSKLFDGLTGHLDQASGTLLSIGSGSGLFECLLAYRFPSLSVIGVDVAPVDVFLGDGFRLVREGSCPVVLNVSVLLAVYLRRPSILISYLEWFPDVHTIILLGPRSEDPLADHDVAGALQAWGSVVAFIEDGIAPWDLFQVVKKHQDH